MKMKKRLIKKGNNHIRLLSRNEYPDMYDNQDGNYPYGFFVNDKLVGKIRVTHSNNEDFYGISRFVVEKQFRNKGIGTQLLEFVISKYGYYNLLLNVRQSNIEAIELYKKYGFVIIYVDNKDDFYIMKRIKNI